MSEGTEGMTADAADITTPNLVVAFRCPGCAADARPGDRFCEACGRELGGRSVALPPANTVADAAPSACAGCGGVRYDADRYCLDCGQLRGVPDRFDADLGAVAVVTDRGISHAHNEDSVAAAVIDGMTPHLPLAVLVTVCDGVSTSEDPQAASGAGTRVGLAAARDALARSLPPQQVAMAGLAAAAQAVRDIGGTHGHAPSCTFVSAFVEPGPESTRITVANVGDSRAYWLRAPVRPDTDWARNPPSQRLTSDDSWAQALVDAGAMDEQAAMRDPKAHTLLRWLGADSPEVPWSDTCVRTVEVTGPGALLLCSDGLWNYLPDSDGLAEVALGSPPSSAARELVEFALRCGGNDNITVALVPIPWSPQPGVS
ncbi:PP2C family serine/threonine-protein phosphatase [Nocardia callitridis]|uniref:PPM-type phosphatase domain-containing protein n=1 Tax=Nocardia callitridis TaxID=648753 RepID=A0ABP9K352_9NOCA